MPMAADRDEVGPRALGHRQELGCGFTFESNRFDGESRARWKRPLEPGQRVSDPDLIALTRALAVAFRDGRAHVGQNECGVVVEERERLARRAHASGTEVHADDAPAWKAVQRWRDGEERQLGRAGHAEGRFLTRDAVEEVVWVEPGP